MTLKIDYSSLRSAVGGEISQLMIYGFNDCKLLTVLDVVRKDKEGPTKIVFDWNVGNLDETHTTLEGRKLYKIKNNQADTGIMKSALVNIVYENFRRSKENLPLIPVIVIIDASDSWPVNYYPPHPHRVIVNRKRYTFKELRRIYRLCEDPTLPKEIQEIAKKTFTFVRVEKVSESSIYSRLRQGLKFLGKTLCCGRQKEHVPSTYFKFKKIDAPWEGRAKEAWNKAWSEHQLKKPYPSRSERLYLNQKKAKGFLWRAQLLRLIKT